MLVLLRLRIMVDPSKSAIDFNHPLFLHPSDTPGTLLVSHQLLGVKNYNVWSRTMKIALLAKNKLRFVDGTCSKGSFPDKMGYQWEWCNAIMLSWILNTVNKKLSAVIVFASSATAVWNDLGERFHKIDGSRIYFLHREITSYLKHEYDVLVPTSTYGCEQSRQSVVHHLQQRLFQFLMGLNETYNAVRSQILLLNPLPSVNHAYSMLVQEESQRQHSPNDIGSDPVSFHLAHMVQKKRFNGTCDHCKIKGHKRENCYRLIGYPADFKFTKKKVNLGPGSVANNATVIDSTSGNDLNSNVLTLFLIAILPHIYLFILSHLQLIFLL
ncbi:hypothetical protein PVK06_007103 [Gossypium arboreum]|uniref:Retrotransposon Copia-like N-terminal domain-containing protein n=1 Tax=Gossypium arboreum TaxID=29729 RepID=A0ABR0QGE7_GOSAR|nr:hypothetical protein PVK06_007103 [Gossypium arboreum]